ncbi:TAF12-like protein, partial [Mya arenaria]
MTSTPNTFVAVPAASSPNRPLPGMISQHITVPANMIASSPGGMAVTASGQMLGLPVRQVAPPSTTSVGGGVPTTVSTVETKVLDKRRLQELVKEVDPLEQMDEDVEEVLMQIADEFIESVVTASCKIAKHRKSNTLESKDVQLHLGEQIWGLWVPGFGTDELRPYKKANTTEAHK